MYVCGEKSFLFSAELELMKMQPFCSVRENMPGNRIGTKVGRKKKSERLGSFWFEKNIKINIFPDFKNI